MEEVGPEASRPRLRVATWFRLLQGLPQKLGYRVRPQLVHRVDSGSKTLDSPSGVPRVGECGNGEGVGLA